MPGDIRIPPYALNRGGLGGSPLLVTIASSQNDYNPTGFSVASVIEINCTVASNLTGMLPATTDGSLKVLQNVGAAILTIKDDVTSTDDYRFNLDQDLALGPNTGAMFMYDLTNARWNYVGHITHSGTEHTGNIFPSTAAAQTLGATYIDIAESGEPGVPASGSRRLFVHNSDGELKVKDTSGNVIALEQLPNDQKFAYLVSDEAARTTTTVSNVALGFFPVEASSLYKVEVEIFYLTSSTGGIKFDFTGPSGASAKFWYPAGHIGGVAAFNPLTTPQTNASIAGTFYFRFQGLLTMSSTAGNFQLRAALNSAVGNMTIQTGTNLVGIRLA